jgi:hypothetical protein
MIDTNQKQLGNTLQKIADETHKDRSGFQPFQYGPIQFLGRCPRLVWNWAVGPWIQQAPKARSYTSPEHE